MIRFFDPLVHYSDIAALQSVGGFVVAGSPTIQGTGGFDGGSHLRMSGADVVQVPIGAAIVTHDMGDIASTDVRVFFRLKVDERPSAEAVLLKTQQNGVDNCFARITPAMGFRAVQGDGTPLGAVASIFRQGVWHSVLLDIRASDTGYLQVYVDGSIRMNISGDFDWNAGFVDLIQFGNAGNSLPSYVHIDHILVYDASVGDEFATLRSNYFVLPDLPDSTSQTPAVVSGAATPHQALDDALNATTDGDATHVQNGGSDVVAVGYPAVPSPLGSIYGIAAMVEAREGDGPQPDSAAVFLNSSGARSAGLDMTPGLDPGNYRMFRKMASADPNTAAAWTEGGASAVELEVVTGLLTERLISDGITLSDDLVVELEAERSIAETLVLSDQIVADFTAGAPNTPDNILDAATEQLVWYDPSLGFTTPTGKGSAWVDQFGTAYPHDLAQATGVRQPNHFASGGMNSQPYVQFESSPAGEQDWMNSPTGLGGGQFPSSMLPYCWAVAKCPSPSGSGVLCTFVDTAGGGHRFVLWNFIGSWRITCITTSGSVFLTGPAANSSWHLFRWGYDGSNVFVKIDNGSTTTLAQTGTLDLSPAGAHVAIGSSDGLGGGSVFGNIDIGEIIGARIQPSAGQQTSMLAYLNAKYAGGWT